MLDTSFIIDRSIYGILVPDVYFIDRYMHKIPYNLRKVTVNYILDSDHACVNVLSKIIA